MAVPTRDHRRPMPPELKELIARANRGDLQALQKVQRAFDQDPDLTAFVGDLAAIGLELLAGVAGGPDGLATNDAILLQAAALENALAADAGSELERLLARRVALCTVLTGVADCKLAAAERAGSAGLVRDALHRAGRAEARLLAAAKALAQVRQLLRPVRSPLSLLRASPKPEPGEFRRPAAPVPDLIPAEVN